MAGFLTDVTVVVHFAALLYIGFGGFLAWRWPRTLAVHALFALWGVAVNILPLTCPLTALEDWLRSRQGLGPLPGGFNEYYIYDVLIPRSLLPVTMRGRLGHFSRFTAPVSSSTSIISGLTIARHRTVLVCPPNTCVQRPVSRSQMRTVRSVDPLTSVFLVAASAQTPPSWPSRERRSSPVAGE